ncbi:glycosyltransferase [Actinoplanes aureus]|uniref:Glycosyltransferase n=1 Tax=Actinoplanes aureus TaxID=2792083 RepID=A0A931C1J4_9ACTN|nr:glycosyltransferase [Actinoplanes aureus]MBG0561609.1 glycosyltransferase [Actinoplanes aureus]
MSRSDGTRPPRVLYLAFYFPPSRASGVYRARATANHLTAQGWDVTVFAAPLRFFYEAVGSVDEKLLETIDPRIKVKRPWLNQFIWDHDVRKFSRFRRQFPILAKSFYDLSLKPFPEHYSSWGLASVIEALKEHARNPFDIVVATGNPFASFASAYLINRLTGVPFVVDYRDAWTLDLFKEKPAFPDGHSAWGWERRVLEKASAAVFVNDALRQWHADRYPRQADKMMIVPNGWDPDVLEDPKHPGLEPRDEHRPLRYSYVGTVTGAQPVREMVEAWEKARTHPLLADAEFNIYGHLGFFKGGHISLSQQLNLGEDNQAGGSGETRMYYRGPVSKTEVAHAYAESDILVFLAGGAKYVTSGKIFEYMANGRPIVSVHAPGIAAAEVLADYPLWFNANSLDPDDIAQSMIEAGKAAEDLTPEVEAAALKHAQQYTRENVLLPFEAKLRSFIRRK